MCLFASVVLSAVLMNPSGMQVDSLKSSPVVHEVIDKQVERIFEEIDATDGVNAEFISDTDTLKIVKLKFDFGLLFDPGESTLNEAMKNELTQISEILIHNPATVISIVGHTDNISTFKINQKISESRARVVADFLLAKDVPSSQLKEIIGRSYAEPVADNSTAIGRAKNRRTEMYIISSPLVENPTGNTELLKDTLKIQPTPASLQKLFDEVVKQPQKSNNFEIEIDGLLVDDTKTKTGKEFYDLFYSQWQAPAEAKNYTITISEKPFRLSSTLIVVSINDTPVYQSVLQPRQDIVEGLSVDALTTTQSYLSNYEEIMKQLNGDDMSGSGIF